jgi:predicted peptidase
MSTSRKITAYTYIGDFGQMVESVRIECLTQKINHEDITLNNCYVDCCTSIPSKGVLSVDINEGDTLIKFDPFLYNADFSIEAAGITINKNMIDKVVIKNEDLFGSFKEDDVLYRMYEPNAHSPRPLILFLHGGGECGTDNLWQLTGTLGAIRLAEYFPDMYVLAPQAPDYGISVQEMFAKMQAHSDPFRVCIGKNTDIGTGNRGWNRDYVGRVCDLIRKLIADGKVDAERVYVIGMSMGGAGVITTVSVAPDLFAAAVPICPSMNGDSYPLLANWPSVPVYIASAYIDHQAGRHAYILRACSKLWAEGQRDINFTLFTPEELEKYGIFASPNLTEAQIRETNHKSWILVLHNEYGILDWMISHRKKSLERRSI